MLLSCCTVNTISCHGPCGTGRPHAALTAAVTRLVPTWYDSQLLQPLSKAKTSAVWMINHHLIYILKPAGYAVKMLGRGGDLDARPQLL